MSMGATLSILGLYNWDNSIFDLMEYPTGFSAIQKETVRDNILVECAELECLYPNPEVMKNVIAIWSRKEKPYWDRVFKAASEEYNPIENYRRTETEQISDGRTEKHSGSDVGTRAGSDRNIASGSDRQTGNNTNTETNSGTDTVNNSVTGYDSNTLVNHDSSATIHGHVITDNGSGSNTQQYGRVDTMEHNTTDTLKHGENIEHSGNTDRTLLAFGNIGVTTSQEMLTQEMEIAKIINVIPIIIESFKDRFCILVY